MGKQNTPWRCVAVALLTVVAWQFFAWPLLKWSVSGTYNWVSRYQVVKKEKIEAYRSMLESFIPEDMYCDLPYPTGYANDKTGEYMFSSMTSEEVSEWYYGELYDWSQCMKRKYHYEEARWIQQFLDNIK